jgi:hypothetical protein
MTFVVLDCRESARFHAVDVKRSRQVIDLVLQNPRVPTIRDDRSLLTPLV